MTRPRCLRRASSAAALTVAACTCSSPDASKGGSLDSGSGVDASIYDAPIAPLPEAAPPPEAGAKGIVSCLGEPPSTEPVPAGFGVGAKRLPGLPADVYVFDVPPGDQPLSWKACGTGCLELENTWAPELEHPLIVTTKGGLVRGVPWLMLKQRLAPDRLRTWIGPADGLGARALGETDFPTSAGHGFSSPVAVDVAGYFQGVYYQDQAAWLIGGAISEPPKCVATGFTTSLKYAVFAPDRWLGITNTSWAMLGVWPPRQGRGAVPLITPGQVNEGTLAGGAIVLGGFNGTRHLWLSHGTQGVTPLVAPEPDGQDCCPASDGARLVWKHGTGYKLEEGVAKWKRVELRTAPVPLGAPPIATTVVGVLPTPYMDSRVWLHGDHALLWVVEGALVIRISDARAWLLPHRLAKDDYWVNALFVSNTEVGLLAKANKSYTPWVKTVVRYQLDSLGPGQPLEEMVAGGDGG